MAVPFALRGVIEGFYGRPWSRHDRLDVVEFCAGRGMNAYVYAPKDDPHHRARWREPYDADERAMFVELGRHCDDVGVRFGFALSPGLDIDYRSSADHERLLDKLLAALDLGAHWLVVAFDDLPGRTSAGPEQAELVARLAGGVWARAPGTRVSLVPTEYVGTGPSPYLDHLAAGLPDGVDVAWTGRWVVSPTITAADARARAAAMGGRPPLIWDNYPVNDGGMASSLFLGPYTGREPGLAGACVGVLCNPMPLAQASKVALATAAAFLSDPDGYRADEAWAAAIEAVGGDGAPVLRVLAIACADSVLTPAADTAVHRLLDRFDAGEVGLDDVVELLVRCRDAAAAAAERDEPLWGEVRPWLDQLHVEARAGLAALRLLVAVDEGDRDEAAHAAEGLQAAWVRARSGPLNLFGPRFACYPAVTGQAGGDRAVDLATGVVEDASAVDRLCRSARTAYRRWLTERDDEAASA